MEQAGVYILQSDKNGRYYIGSTNNIKERLGIHNSGRVKSTVNLRPFVLKVFIVCLNSTEAKRAEYRLKKYKRRDILEKVINDSTFPWEHSVNIVPE